MHSLHWQHQSRDRYVVVDVKSRPTKIIPNFKIIYLDYEVEFRQNGARIVPMLDKHRWGQVREGAMFFLRSD
jgi:hypothetical protein